MEEPGNRESMAEGSSGEPANRLGCFLGRGAIPRSDRPSWRRRGEDGAQDRDSGWRPASRNTAPSFAESGFGMEALFGHREHRGLRVSSTTVPQAYQPDGDPMDQLLSPQHHFQNDPPMILASSPSLPS